MKTLKSACLAFSAMAIIAMTGISFKVAANPGSGTDKYQQNNAIVRDDISAVQYYKTQIRELEAKCKKDKAANRDEAVITDKRDLKKLRADLKREEAYLAADKTILVHDRKLAIKACRNEIRKDRANLVASRRKLDKALDKGNEQLASAEAINVAQYQQELNNDRARLDRAQDYLADDLAYIDKQLNKKEVNYAPVPVPAAETAYERTRGKR